VFLGKRVENGEGFVKSGPFLDAGCIVYSISIFYFTFCLFGGVRTHATHPLPTGLQLSVTYTGEMWNICHFGLYRWLDRLARAHRFIVRVRPTLRARFLHQLTDTSISGACIGGGAGGGHRLRHRLTTNDSAPTSQVVADSVGHSLPVHVWSALLSNRWRHKTTPDTH